MNLPPPPLPPRAPPPLPRPRPPLGAPTLEGVPTVEPILVLGLPGLRPDIVFGILDHQSLTRVEGRFE